MKKRIRILAQIMCVILGLQMLSVPVWSLETNAGTAQDPLSAARTAARSSDNNLRLWYDEPVGAAKWENRALPIGNGTIGGLTYGEIVNERLHVNEKTLWTGGPADSRPNYNGLNRSAPLDMDKLAEIRANADDKTNSPHGKNQAAMLKLLEDNFYSTTNQYTPPGYGSYQDFGDVYFRFIGLNAAGYTNYVRDLDMKTAVSSVSFDQGGVHYDREYFASHPDDVMVSHFTASEDGKLSFQVNLSNEAAAMSATNLTYTASGNMVYMKGRLSENQEQFLLAAGVYTDGGTVSAVSSGSAGGTYLSVTGANSATVYIHADTDYKNEYPNYRDGRTLDQIQTDSAKKITDAADKGYEAVRTAHIADHSSLFDRVDLDLGGTVPDMPTDELMAAYRKLPLHGESSSDVMEEGDKLAVEEMAFQMGRYLTIAASRNGDDLPSNLVGIWLVGSAANYWRGDFHLNVNLQMNYWPTLLTNLAECYLPINEFVASQVVPGRLSAANAHGVSTENWETTPIGEGNGFAFSFKTNPYGMTGPVGDNTYAWNVGGAAWILQNVYDYYRFTNDQEYLKETIYPMLKEQAVFWDQFLFESTYQTYTDSNGDTQKRLVVGPSVSAEHGPVLNGTTYDQSFVWELYKMAAEASELLGVDEQLRAGWQERQAQLDPIIIGESGQVKEWYEESTLHNLKANGVEEPVYNLGGGPGASNYGTVHRHTSHLVGLYPGTLISKDTEDWLDASLVSLRARDLTGHGTGWSMAMKINMWARTGLGDDTYHLVQSQIAGNASGLLDNLLDSHPPYQIDGNYGLTAGMAEMLLQSQLGYTQFLPTLPSAWHTGSVKGLVARGNFEVDMDWQDGIAEEFKVKSRAGAAFVSEYQNLSEFTVTDSSGTPVAFTKINENRITFDTTEGETYTFVNTTPDKLIEQIRQAQEVADSISDTRLASYKSALLAAIAAAQTAVDSEDEAQYDSNIEILKALRLCTEAAIALAARIAEAEAVYRKATGWTAAEQALTELETEIRAASILLRNPQATLEKLTAETSALKSTMDAVNALINAVGLTISVSGGAATITATDPNVEIRYTFDGNAPSAISRPYGGSAVQIPSTCVSIQAAAFIGEQQISEIVSKAVGTNLARNKPAASNYPSYSASYVPAEAVDGDTVSRWATAAGATAAVPTGTVDLIVDLQGNYLIGNTSMSQYSGRVTEYAIQVSTETTAMADFRTVYQGSFGDGTAGFVPVEAKYVRFLTLAATGDPSIYEFDIYGADAPSSLADQSGLTAALTAAAAIKNSDVYTDATRSMKDIFDYYIDAATAVSKNPYSDADTVAAATNALNGKPLEFAIKQAKESAAAITDARLAAYKEELETAITNAEAVIENGETSEYTAAINNLQNAVKQASAPIALLDELSKAEAVYKQTAGLTVEDAVAARAALKMAIDDAHELLQNTQTTESQFAAQILVLQDTAAAAANLLGAVGLTITLSEDKKTASITVTGENPDPGFEIRYTFDGNDPSLISRIYEEPATVPDTSNIIRAAVFLGDMQVSAIVELSLGGNGSAANIALNKTAASNWPHYITTGGVHYPASNALDGTNMQWAVRNPTTSGAYPTTPITVAPSHKPDLIVDLGAKYSIEKTVVKVPGSNPRFTAYEIQVSDTLTDIDSLTTITGGLSTPTLTDFRKIGEKSAVAAGTDSEIIYDGLVEARYIRFLATTTSSNETNVTEFEVYGVPSVEPAPNQPDLTAALAAADAFRAGESYGNAPQEMKDLYDYYYDVATAVSERNSSDFDTVAAAIAALEETQAQLDWLYYNISIDGRVLIMQNHVPDEGGDLYNPKFTLLANEAMDVTLLIAAYDESGRLLSVEAQPLSLTPDIEVSVQKEVVKMAGVSYRCFLWDSEMKPLTKVIS